MVLLKLIHCFIRRARSESLRYLWSLLGDCRVRLTCNNINPIRRHKQRLSHRVRLNLAFEFILLLHFYTVYLSVCLSIYPVVGI